MSAKETVMVLKVVDLQCPCCCTKLKKILCKFPQIQDQTYDKKANTVTITVFCCNPEKIRDKLCCEGFKVINSIEIKDPPKTKDECRKQGNKTTRDDEGNQDDKKGQGRDHPPFKTETVSPVVNPPKGFPTRTCCRECSEGRVGGPCNHGNRARTCCQQCSEGRGGGPCNHGNRARTCCQQCSEGRGGGPCNHGNRARTCCQQCSEGRGGGPCNHGHEMRTCYQQCAECHGGGPCYHGLGYHPYPPQPCYCGCGGYGHGNEHRGGYHYYCYTEESPQNCSIM